VMELQNMESVSSVAFVVVGSSIHRSNDFIGIWKNSKSVCCLHSQKYTKSNRNGKEKEARFSQKCTMESKGSSASSVTELKGQLFDVLQSTPDMGVFGIYEESVKQKLTECIHELESIGPVVSPTSSDGFEILDGRWKVCYTSLTILGHKRIKLGLAPSGTKGLNGIVSLTGIYQDIESANNRAKNEVAFSVMGMVDGLFWIDTEYCVESEDMVAVKTQDHGLKPEKLAQMLGENVGLLLKIFRPDGTLRITYLDSDLRIGRNDRDQIFVLQKQ